MAMTTEETIEQLHRREREALLQAAKSKTLALGCAAGLVGVVIGVYVGRDITMRLVTDFLNNKR